MKLFFILIFFSSIAFGAEVKTDCPMMREMMRRDNPKAKNNISYMKIKSNSDPFQASRQ